MQARPHVGINRLLKDALRRSTRGDSQRCLAGADAVDVIALHLATCRALSRKVALLVSRAAAKILICIVMPGHRDRDIKLAVAVGVLAQHVCRLKFIVGLLRIQNVATGVVVNEAIGTRAGQQVNLISVGGRCLQASEGALGSADGGLTLLTNADADIVALRSFPEPKVMPILRLSSSPALQWVLSGSMQIASKVRAFEVQWLPPLNTGTQSASAMGSSEL